MASPYEALTSSIQESVATALEGLGYGAEGLQNSIGMSERSGDISCSIAFRASKERKKDPAAVAAEVASRLGMIPMIRKAEAEGGFINFYIDRKEFSKEVIGHALREKDSVAASGMGKGAKMIVEYPSANPVHPLHVGQLRNAVLGDAISNIYKSCGYRVERQDYIDDLGLQAAEAVWGTMHIDSLEVKQSPERKFDHSLGEIYVEVHRRAEKEPGIMDEVKETLRLMEQDGTYESKLSREMAESYVRAEYETAFAFSMYHDVLIWESDIVRERLVDKALRMLKGKGITKEPKAGKYSGCVIIDVKDLGELPRELQGLREESKVLVRSDGTPNYIAKDIAFHMWKFGIIENSFKYAKMIDRQPNGEPLYTTAKEGTAMDFGGAAGTINPIDTRQSYEQTLIKAVFSSMGEAAHADMLKHLAYGVVQLEHAPLAGRKGTWVGYTADDILREATEKALSLIKERSELGEGEQARIARSVAVAAIKFEFLKVSPERSIVFSWKRALNFEGNSGPYCQYTYARASRILEKAQESQAAPEPKGSAAFEEEEAFLLVKHMSRCADMMQKAARECRPNVISDYLILLAMSFSRFYETVPVLKGPKEEREARLALISAFRHVMKAMLNALGIDAIDRM